MAFAYAKPPVYYYQTIDRTNLQFTKYPVFSVHTPQPPPPDPTTEHDEQVAGEQHDEQVADEQHDDGGHGDEAAADDVGEVGEGKSGL